MWTCYHVYYDSMFFNTDSFYGTVTRYFGVQSTYIHVHVSSYLTTGVCGHSLWMHVCTYDDVIT